MDVGYEMMFNNFSFFDLKDIEGFMDVLLLKDLSFNGLLIVNDLWFLGDLNSVSELIDVVGIVKRGSYGGYLNLFVILILNL